MPEDTFRAIFAKKWLENPSYSGNSARLLCGRNQITFSRRNVVWRRCLVAANAFAGDADINCRRLTASDVSGRGLSGHALLYLGLAICAVGALFGFCEYGRCRALPVHKAMSEVSNIIWETCKTYLLQQGKFLALLWVLIAVCMVYYF